MSNYLETFRSRIRSEICDYVDMLEAEDRPYPNASEVLEYINTIVRDAFQDPDYIDMSETQSDPARWENDYFRECIMEYSDLYAKYPIDEIKLH